MTTNNRPRELLVVGLGNLLMGDEGAGVHAVQALQRRRLPEGVECLDGAVGGFHLLAPLQSARRVVLIDANADDLPPGTVRRFKPRSSRDYPRTLIAHDMGLKDLLDAFHAPNRDFDVVMFAISIRPARRMELDLSREVEAGVKRVLELVMDEIRPGLTPSALCPRLPREPADTTKFSPA